MRPVQHGDVVAAARVIRAVPEARRDALVGRMLDEARWADAYRKRTGRAHPLWGDGSLMAAALMRGPEAEPTMRDTVYLQCLVGVLEAVVAARLQCPEAHATQTAAAGSISSRRGGMSSPQSQQ